MKKLLLGVLLGLCIHWGYDNISVEVKVKTKVTTVPQVATIVKNKVIAAAKPTPKCGTTCLQKKLPSLESSLAQKKKELKTKVEVKEPSAEQLVALGILSTK